MVSEADYLRRWKTKWNAWADTGVPQVKKNAKECEEAHPDDKEAKFGCLMKKNAETLTKDALGL